jgi:hypothetical protein
MSKLRDVFRAALDAQSPTPAEARADLDRILARAWRRRQLTWVALAAAAVFSVAVAVTLTRGHAPERGPTATSDHSMHLYVKRADERESDALSFSLTVPGDP